MLIDLGPLRRHRDFRALYAGQFVSSIGSMITYVAIPYQVYELTKSSLAVGLLSTVQLLPLLFAALFGGATADAVVLLALAGAADMVSALYRMTIWNQTIPDALRGRLAGVEMISYASGPLLGNARAGWLAGAVSPRFSIVSGGWMCVAGVLLCIPLLPGFWRYRSDGGASLASDANAAR